MPPQVSAIVLAAGLSSRMGKSKPLLPLGDRPVIHHCLASLIAAGIQDIQVVIGPAGDGISAAVDQLPVKVVRNPDHASDMAGSVRVGLRGISPNAVGVLVCLADHPLVTADTYHIILEQQQKQPEAIIIPVHQGEKGHPTLFPRQILAEIAVLPTLRDITRKYGEMVRLVAVTDAGVALDMDTPEDYARVVAAYATRNGDQKE
jgi:CTP:molybdopterin cytidylyltransferase MocA